MEEINYHETPILFAQTREDPMIEINTLLNIQKKINDSLNICLIASGGDTISSILSENLLKIKSVDVIDINPHQIKLTQLKIGLMQLLDKNLLKKFLTDGFNHSVEKIKLVLLILLKENFIIHNTYTYWLDHIKLLQRGINQSGRFELLLKDTMRNNNIDTNFSYYNLCQVLGKKAVVSSTLETPSKHFSSVLSIYRNLYKYPDDNYFYYQFVFDAYGSNRPPYLSINKKPTKITTKIRYYAQEMIEHLSQIADNTYDLIHLSNITDLIDSSLFFKLIQEVGRTLKIGGVATLRRLNSDTKIISLLTQYKLRLFIKKENAPKTYKKYNFKIETNLKDRSHFYNEIIRITKF